MATTALTRLANINFEIFHNNDRLLGSGSVTLPNLEFSNAEIKGAGVAGTFNAPIIGFVESAEIEIDFRTINTDLFIFGEMRAIDLLMYGAMENYNHGTGALKPEQVRIATRALPKNVEMGKLEPASSTESKFKLEVITLDVKISGAEVLYFDKINYIYRSHGVDYLSDVRKALNI